MREQSVAISCRPTAGSQAFLPPGVGWLYGYLGAQIFCQLALLVPLLAPARIAFRIAAFGVSLAFLLFVRGRSGGLGVARTLLAASLLVMALSALNPDGAGPLAAVAHWSFQLAIIGPAFWATRLRLDSAAFQRVVLVLWGFSSASAVMGVLQTIFPGKLQPSISTVLTEHGPGYLAARSIRLASGEWILRPTGLSDIPGGAASGGLFAILLGVGVIVARPFRGARALGLVSMVAGMTCLYMSQIRAALVMLGICLLTLLVILTWVGRFGRVLGVLAIGFAVSLIGFAVALDLGGSSVTDRLGTLTTDSPGAVYYKNRGIFLEHTIAELLSEYPLGAGLGRWGMMNAYFAGRARMIWVEIQWTGWLLDGGILLLCLYPAAVLATFWNSLGLARRHASGGLGIWAALIAAYNVGAIALTFSYPFFMSASGLEFWLLNAALTRAAAVESEATLQSTSERPS